MAQFEIHVWVPYIYHFVICQHLFVKDFLTYTQGSDLIFGGKLDLDELIKDTNNRFQNQVVANTIHVYFNLHVLEALLW